MRALTGRHQTVISLVSHIVIRNMHENPYGVGVVCNTQYVCHTEIQQYYGILSAATFVGTVAWFTV